MEKNAVSYRLMYLKSGKMTFQTKKETFALQPGDVLFMPAGTQYSTMAFGKPVELYNILFNFTGDGQVHDNRLAVPQFTMSASNAKVTFSDVQELNACRLFKVPFIGEAAGIAAAIACESGCAFKDVDIDVLHAKLTENNALY